MLLTALFMLSHGVVLLLKNYQLGIVLINGVLNLKNAIVTITKFDQKRMFLMDK